MALESGTRLAHYEITDQIGKGGMGEVYRARDTKLGREVAIKTLPREFAEDPDRLARFEREARLLASLNHPNIAAIYGLEEHEGSRFLVLELVEGDTLADRLQRGAIPVEESLKLALQIAEALEAAHEKGVIHRDLKPANIKVTPDGKVKVLDFGLAKAFVAEGSDPNLSQSPTLSLAATRQGILLGTAGYMSPEQARGQETDKRADVWAFGCVVFEMLTGRGTFDGRTVSDVLASVLAKDPEWDGLPHNLHPRLRMLLERCLEKDIRDRYGSISDARVDIESVLADPHGPVITPATDTVGGVPQAKLPWIAAVVLVAVMTGVAVWSLTRPGALPMARFDVTPDAMNLSTVSVSVAIAPDGRSIAYTTGGSPGAGGDELYVRHLDQLVSVRLNPQGLRINNPFFSPDGRQIGFYENGTNTMGSHVLKRVSVSGGTVSLITELDGNLRGASWGDDDTIVFATSNSAGLLRVAAVGGEPERLTTLDTEAGEILHRWPEILPGGDAVLFTVIHEEGPEIAVLRLDTREYRVVVGSGSFPRYSPTGHLLYGADGTLWAVGFDLGRLETVGDPVPVLEGVLTKGLGASEFGLSDNGTLLYAGGDAPLENVRLVWLDRDGSEEIVGIEPDVYSIARIAPDGRRVALGSRDVSDDLWIWDFELQTRTRVLVGEPAASPLWTADSSRVAFGSYDTGDIRWKAASNVGSVETLATAVGGRGNGRFPSPYFFTPDGTGVVFRDQANPETNDDIVLVTLEEGTRVPLLNGPYRERNADLSPNGRWMAYESDESGRFEIYVRPFPDVEEDRIQVSSAGGNHPRWSRDGRELLYMEYGTQPRMMSVAVDPDGPALSITGRTGMFDWPVGAIGEERKWDVSSNGRFLALMTGPDEGSSNQLVLVQNWFQELLERVPVD